MKRLLLGTILFAAAVGVPAAARAECTVIIASTPTGSTFPCTVCIEGGRPVSIMCTPPILGR
jgi:hypothetical protein